MKTPEQLRDEYTFAKPICCADTPDAHTVWLKIGKQSFCLSYDAETLARANHMRSMLGEALHKLLELEQ